MKTHRARLSFVGPAFLLALAVAVVRCGSSSSPPDQSVGPVPDAGPATSPDAGPGVPDGGPTADGGTGGGSTGGGDVDAGGGSGTGGGGTDAGTGGGGTDAGTGGGGTDAGTGGGIDGGSSTAGGYDVIDLWNASGSYIVAGLNNLGQVVGKTTSGSVIYDSRSGTTTTIDSSRDVTPAAINDRGEVLFNEESHDVNSPWWQRPFVQRDFHRTYLPSFGGQYTTGISLGPNGEVVGHGRYPSAQNFQDRAFLWIPGDQSLRDLGTLGGRQSTAMFVDGSGTVVGWATTGYADNIGSAFVWRDGKMTKLSDVGGPSIANWRASSGTIVGMGSRTPDSTADPQPLIWSGSDVRILGKLAGDSYGQALAVNSSGDVVGYSDTTPNNGNARAVLWRNGGDPVRIDSLATFREGVVLWHGVSINEGGQILAYGGNPGTGPTYFLLTPRK